MKKSLPLILMLPLLGCGSVPVETATPTTPVTPEPVKTKEQIAEDFAAALREAQNQGSKQMDEARKQLQGYANAQNEQVDKLYKGLGKLSEQRQEVLKKSAEAIQKLYQRFEVYKIKKTGGK